MSKEISDLEARLQHLKESVSGAASAAVSGVASAVARVRGRKPGRPGRPPGKRGPGRPPGSGKKRRGRPPASAKAASAPAAGAESAPAAKGGKKARKRAPITSEQLASRQLQGRYLALVRRFPAAKRAGFAKTAKEKGREAAIKEMQDGLGGSKK